MRTLSIALLSLSLGACAASDTPVLDARSSTPAIVRADTALPRAVPTTVLRPTPIRVAVGDLPEPFATESARKGPDVISPPDGARLAVPEGFAVQVWADGLEAPRWLALAPDGSVLLAESRRNRIRRLHDSDGNGVADEVSTFATELANGLNQPLGMAFGPTGRGGAVDFFVGNTDEVRRYPMRVTDGKLGGRGERIASLPGGGYNQHWTRNVVATPDGDSLYVTVGSQSNVDVEELPRASVFRIALDGSGPQTVSYGLRNPVGLAFHPATGAAYTTVNERDRLGDGLVPDYLTRIGGNRFYGWPFAYLAPDNLDPRRMNGPRSEAPELAAQTVTPDVLFEAHSAALGLAFYPESGPFPARYHGGGFVAFRGSWNRDEGTGYKIVHVPFENGRPVGHYEDFVTGFLVDPSGPTTWARPVGTLVLPDGSLLFTDEANGRVYRVSWTG